MRAGPTLVGLMILGAAGLMAYLWVSGGDCPGGRDFYSIESCVASGRSSDRCRSMMAEAHDALTRAGPVFNTREQCVAQHGNCQEARGATGFAPRAAGFCVMPGPPERIVPRLGTRAG